MVPPQQRGFAGTRSRTGRAELWLSQAPAPGGDCGEKLGVPSLFPWQELRAHLLTFGAGMGNRICRSGLALIWPPLQKKGGGSTSQRRRIVRQS